MEAKGLADSLGSLSEDEGLSDEEEEEGGANEDEEVEPADEKEGDLSIDEKLQVEGVAISPEKMVESDTKDDGPQQTPVAPVSCYSACTYLWGARGYQCSPWPSTYDR